MHYRAGANGVNSKTHQLSLEITHMADEREMQGYTTAELQRETGFDRRTIAYYVHEGLLPKVGRRGSRTRYPKLVRDRLLFIRAVREAEQRGTVAPVSLRDLREIFQQAPPELISRVADGRTSVTPEVVAGTSPSFRPLSRRRAAIEDRWGPVREDRTRVGSPRRLADSSFHEPRQADLESPEAHDCPDSGPEDLGNRRATVDDGSDVTYQREASWGFRTQPGIGARGTAGHTAEIRGPPRPSVARNGPVASNAGFSGNHTLGPGDNRRGGASAGKSRPVPAAPHARPGGIGDG